MRLLAAEDVVTEPDLETYAANEKTSIHTDWGWRDGLIHLYVGVYLCRRETLPWPTDDG